MASTAAVLNIMVAANTAPASAQLTALQAQLAKTNAQANATSGAVGGGLAKGSKMGAVGMVALGAAALGAGKFLSGAVKVTIDFDQKMSSLRATTKSSTKDMARLEKQAMSMGKATVFSATEAAQAQIELAKGGLSVAQILSGGLDAALALAAAGELDLASAASTTVNAMKLFGIEGQNAMKVADMLATAANKTTADVSDFAIALVQGGSIAKQAGINLNQTVTILEALAEAGIRGSDAGTSMKTALLQLLNPTSKQAELAKRLNIEFTDQNGQLKSAAELSGELTAATQGMTKAERVKTFAILAGTDGFRTLSSLYDAGPAKLQALTKANRDYGTAVETANTKTDNLAGDLEQLSGSVEDLQLKVGKTGNPAFRGAIQGLTKLLDGLGEAIIDPSLGNARFFQQLSAIPKAISDVYNLLRNSTASIASSISRSFTRTWNAVRATASERIQKVVEIVGRLGQGVRKAVNAAAAVLKGGWRGAWKGATGVVTSSINRMSRIIRSITSPVRAAFTSVVSIIKSKFRSAYNAVVGFVKGVRSVIQEIPSIKLPSLDINLPFGFQRGGYLQQGRASGDSVPAMLERGEYVLNREAVKKIGVERLNQLNFKNAPRFQKGGFIDTITELPGKFTRPVLDAGTKALDVLMKGPGAFINMLPKPNIPEPFKAVGPFILKKAIALIKEAAKSPLSDNAWVDSNTFAVARFLASKFNASISSSYRSPAQNAAVGGVPNSSHTRGTPSNPGAFDFVPPSSGMQSFAGKNIAGIVENMIHDVGSGLHNHIAFFQRGGAVGARRGRQRDGWVKTGYTVFDDAGGGYLGHLQQGRGYAELGTATQGGVATGRGYIAQALGMSGELRDKFPLDVMINGKKRKMFKRDRGYGQGTPAYSIDIYRDSWPFFGIGRNSKGSAFIRKSATQKQIKKVKEAAREVIASIRKARRAGGLEGFLDAARKNADRGLRLADDGELDRARDKLAKARKQIRKALKGRPSKPSAPGTPAPAPDTPSLPGVPGGSTLEALRRAVAFLEEDVQLFDEQAGLDWSLDGSELHPSERSTLIAKNQALLAKLVELRDKVIGTINFWTQRVPDLRGKVKTAEEKIKDLKKKIKGSKNEKQIGKWQKQIKGHQKDIKGWKRGIETGTGLLESLPSELDDLRGVTGRGGKIQQVQMVLETLGRPTAVSAAEGTDSEIADLLRQQLAESQRALAITQAQMPIFQQFMPRFHQGGIVQGPMGAERPVMAQAGEGIFTREQMRAMGSQNITVVIEDAAIDSNRIRVEVDGVIQDKISTVRRQGSNRRFATK